MVQLTEASGGASRHVSVLHRPRPRATLKPPHQRVKAKYGSKESLASKLAEVLEPRQEETKEQFAKRLCRVPSSKLERLDEIADTVRRRGGRAGLVEEIASYENKVNDRDYRESLASKRALAELLDRVEIQAFKKAKFIKVLKSLRRAVGGALDGVTWESFSGNESWHELWQKLEKLGLICALMEKSGRLNSIPAIEQGDLPAAYSVTSFLQALYGSEKQLATLVARKRRGPSSLIPQIAAVRLGIPVLISPNAMNMKPYSAKEPVMDGGQRFEALILASAEMLLRKYREAQRMWDKGDYDSARQLLMRAYSLMEEANVGEFDIVRGCVNRALATVNSDIGNERRVIRHQNEALRVWEHLNDHEEIVLAKAALACSFFRYAGFVDDEERKAKYLEMARTNMQQASDEVEALGLYSKPEIRETIEQGRRQIFGEAQP